MEYRLFVDSDNMKFIEFKIDVNQQYELADYYLCLTSKYRLLQIENILPKAVK